MPSFIYETKQTGIYTIHRWKIQLNMAFYNLYFTNNTTPNFLNFTSILNWKLHPTFTLCHARCQFHQHSMSSFSLRRSQMCKKDWQLDSLFALSGSARIKTARRMLMNLKLGLVIRHTTNRYPFSIFDG